MKDANDKLTVDLIPEKKMMLAATVSKLELKDGKLKAAIEFTTNFESLWGVEALNAQREAVAMLLLELCETKNLDGEIDVDRSFWEAETFLTGARNLKKLQISEMLTGDNVVPFANAK